MTDTELRQWALEQAIKCHAGMGLTLDNLLGVAKKYVDWVNEGRPQQPYVPPYVGRPDDLEKMTDYLARRAELRAKANPATPNMPGEPEPKFRRIEGRDPEPKQPPSKTTGL
jgi:hypothetical protein